MTINAHPQLTHLDHTGAATLVDVSTKPVTTRRAVASCTVVMLPSTLSLILDGAVSKGDVFATARIAGINAAKKTSEWIPLCHPIGLDAISVELTPMPPHELRIVTTAVTVGRTGVEMEAVVAAAAAGLAIYDMCKAADRSMRVTDIALVEKTGGSSGNWHRSGLQGEGQI